MLITLMFSVAAVKSRTFSSFSYSANEQLCRSWEGAQPGSQPSWPRDIFHIIDIMLSLGIRIGQRAGIFHFCEFKFSPVQEFKFFQEISLFWEFRKI